MLGPLDTDLTLSAIYLVQVAGTAVLGILLRWFYRTYERPYLREWSLSWFALSIYVFGGFLALRVSGFFDPQHPARLSLTIVTLVAGYWHLVWLLFGTYSVARGEPVQKGLARQILIATAAAAVALSLLFTADPASSPQRFFLRLGVRQLAAGAVYLWAGASLVRLRWGRIDAGRNLVAASFILYGVEQLNYSGVSLLELLGIVQFGGSLALLGFLDFALQFFIGLGMAIWLLEEERDASLKAATALRRSEERLARSQRLEAVGQLAGGIAHDFNNLLTVIIGRCEMLMSRLAVDGIPWREVKQIDEAAGRGATLVQQLLAFSRRQVLAPRSVDLNEIVEGIEPMLRRSIGEQVVIEQQLAPDLGWVKVDPGQVEQVLVNLVLNARDAMPDGGKLVIETSNLDVASELADSITGLRPGEHVALVVRDTGRGMEEETRQHIFEPFFTTKDISQGSGLGLSMVYGIVKQSEGHISVRSEEGEGTTVRICFPRVEPATEEAAVARVIPVGGRTEQGSETVLVVEDEERIKELLIAVLEEQGYRVLVATDGLQAVEMVADQGERIDLLLTDVVMPQMGGAALAERLRATAPELKVLFMTGYSEEVVAKKGIPIGPDNLLEKPFTIPELLGAVRQALDPASDAAVQLEPQEPRAL